MMRGLTCLDQGGFYQRTDAADDAGRQTSFLAELIAKL